MIRFNIFHPTECEKQGNILTQVELRYVALEGLSDDIKLPPPSPHPQLAVRFKVPFEQTMRIISYICKAMQTSVADIFNIWIHRRLLRFDLACLCLLWSRFATIAGVLFTFGMTD